MPVRSQEPPDTAAELVELELQQPEDPAVTAILETNPRTPAELARAAKILADLGRADLAKGLLKRMIDAKLNPQQLADLAERFGSPMFAEMASNESLLPEARQLADVLLTAVNQRLRDPQRLAALIQQLQDPSDEVRYAAMAGLRDGRSAAVAALVAVLADPNRADEHADVAGTLVQMGSEARGPLQGLLESPDPALVVQAIRVLAAANARETSIHLLKPSISETTDPAIRAAAGTALKRLLGRVPGRSEAIRLLARRARAYFDHLRPIEADADGRLEICVWDASQAKCVVKSCSPEEAAPMMAAWLARDAYALAGEDPQIRLLYLATTLESAAYEHGLDKPLPSGEGTIVAEAAGFGAGVVEDLLEYAMAGDHPAAASAAARILGRTGTAERLLRQGVQSSPLVRAARHPDRRLRLAALESIVRLQPTGPFPGSSYVPESVAFFAASGGVRRVLVAGPSEETSRRLVIVLSGMGFSVDTATTGRELMRLASASPDYELALIDASIAGPPIDLLLQQLRHDYRTASLCVGVLARSGHLEQARQTTRRDPMAEAFFQPQTDEALRWQVGQLNRLQTRAFVGLAERHRQAAEALDYLVVLGRREDGPYDVGRAQSAVMTALYTPGLGGKAAAVLAQIGTPASQLALTDLASRWTQPLKVRQVAAQAFRQHVQRYGILLTTKQISQQYDRYNRSENLDVATQQILGRILDCIEAPTLAVKTAGPAMPQDGAVEKEGSP
ncbi:MAG: hypothetical protein JXB62_15585 [Pirellulales bacterium]|nr:hypothetical protein [Pirellulales bacterium]